MYLEHMTLEDFNALTDEDIKKYINRYNNIYPLYDKLSKEISSIKDILKRKYKGQKITIDNITVSSYTKNTIHYKNVVERALQANLIDENFINDSVSVTEQTTIKRGKDAN